MDVSFSDSRNKLRALRPEIPSLDLAAASNPAEQFQQDTLRPLLKYQNELLIAAFTAYTKGQKGVFFSLADPERMAYIEARFRKDLSLRHYFVGILVGHFTMAEYERYLVCEKEIRRRAVNLIIQRLQDQLTGPQST
ncbi:MAG: glyoxalase [Bacteroidota bacterium]